MFVIPRNMKFCQMHFKCFIIQKTNIATLKLGESLIVDTLCVQSKITAIDRNKNSKRFH